MEQDTEHQNANQIILKTDVGKMVNMLETQIWKLNIIYYQIKLKQQYLKTLLHYRSNNSFDHFNEVYQSAMFRSINLNENEYEHKKHMEKLICKLGERNWQFGIAN